MAELEDAMLAALLENTGDEEEEGAATFIASYESTCPDCGDQIFSGETAGYLDGSDEASCWRCLP
jgi:hypothetical protein